MSDQLKLQDAATEDFVQPLYTPIKRRSFFMYAGATAGATALVLAGCSKDDNNVTPGSNAMTVDVGAGDVGVLNYAYALEQLEAAFYAQVLTGAYYSGASAGEKQILADLAIHEKIHADFFKTAITAAAPTQIIKPLTPNFASINFGDRTSVLGAAKAFEDLGVSAYNGAGRFITEPKYLVLAGKIVSVEARHAALIRDLINANSFVAADVVNFNIDGANARQEISKLPADVLKTANTFLMPDSQVSATKLVV